MGHIDGDEYVYCLNIETGQPIWKHKYPCKLVDNLYEGGPGSTPTIHGNYVYTVGKEGQFNRYDKKSGRADWTKRLQSDLGESLPEWGFNTSPYILGDQVIVTAGRVASYFIETGEKNWETSLNNAGYGSAVSFSHKGKTLVAALDCDGLRICDPNNGKEVASYPWDSPYRTNSTTPIIKGDKIFISTGYNVGSALLQLNRESTRPEIQIQENAKPFQQQHFV